MSADLPFSALTLLIGRQEGHPACKNKKLSWCWQQARRVYRSVEVNKHGTIPHATYSFLLCNSNFVFKKFHDLEMGSKVTQGHW